MTGGNKSRPPAKGGIRLIGLDLDNTTLNAEKHITPRVAAAIEGAIAAGIQVVPATGRMLDGITPEFLQIPGVRYALTSNGAKVYDLAENTVLLQDCFTKAQALDVLEECLRHPANVACFIAGTAWSTPFNRADFEGFYPPGIIRYVMDTRHQVEDLAAVIRTAAEPPEKITLMFTGEAARQQTIAALAARGDLTLTSSMPGNLELNTKTANKGAALLALGRHLGLCPARVMAVGDSDNDLEMLRAAGYAVLYGQKVCM